jgi:hypothetical protein
VNGFSPVDIWALSKVLADQPVNGELALVSEVNRPLVSLLATMKPEQRLCGFQGATVLRTDHQAIQRAVADCDPMGPVPIQQPQAFATAADIRRMMAQIRWDWEGWIPKARIIGIASLEGIGKTRFLLDLARRIYLGLCWPDGQPATFPAGTKTIWLCADGHQDEIAEALPLFGLPDEAIVFPAPPDDPYANTNLDSPETLQWLDKAIAAVKPALVIIDTLSYATQRDLCEQRSIAGLKGPLVDLAQRHQTNIALALHVSQAGQALGRRIKGLTRTLIHLECPDPDHHPERLRLWVEKSYAKKPPALGVTIKADGNDYDFTPPSPPIPNRGGRPPAERDKARQFILDALKQQNDLKASALCDRYVSEGGTKSTFWNVRDDLVDDGTIVCDGKPMIIHLVDKDAQNGSSY